MIISWYRLTAQQLLFYRLAQGLQLEISQKAKIHHQKSYGLTDYSSHFSFPAFLFTENVKNNLHLR